MAKQKKAKEEKNTEKPISQNTSATQVGYSGKVSVFVQKNNKTYKLSSNHNEGRKPLFDFLVKCLCGAYSSAAEERPQEIILFKQYDAESVTTPQFNDNCAITSRIVQDSVAFETEGKETSSGEGEYKKYKITYHFTIPKAYITNDVKLYKIGLYHNKAKIDSPSAIYLFTNESGSDWAPVDLPAVGNYTLIIN